MNGLAIIRAEQCDNDGNVTAGRITYAGTFDVNYPLNKKGDEGQCYGQIPGTHLTTKNYESRLALQAALREGASVK